jgi:hypothetical protein
MYLEKPKRLIIGTEGVAANTKQITYKFLGFAGERELYQRRSTRCSLRGYCNSLKMVWHGW